jgi:hypothetical protein
MLHDIRHDTWLGRVFVAFGRTPGFTQRHDQASPDVGHARTTLPKPQRADEAALDGAVRRGCVRAARVGAVVERRELDERRLPVRCLTANAAHAHCGMQRAVRCRVMRRAVARCILRQACAVGRV